MAAMLIFIKLQLNQLPLASDLDLSTKTLVVRQTYSLGDAVIKFYCLSDDSQNLFRRLITEVNPSNSSYLRQGVTMRIHMEK